MEGGGQNQPRCGIRCCWMLVLTMWWWHQLWNYVIEVPLKCLVRLNGSPNQLAAGVWLIKYTDLQSHLERVGIGWEDIAGGINKTLVSGFCWVQMGSLAAVRYLGYLPEQMEGHWRDALKASRLAGKSAIFGILCCLSEQTCPNLQLQVKSLGQKKWAACVHTLLANKILYEEKLFCGFLKKQ